MSHTHEGKVATFHVNGDFSGDVSISIPTRLTERRHGRNECYTEIKIPFDDLKMLVAKYVRDKIIDVAEQASDDTILLGHYEEDA